MRTLCFVITVALALFAGPAGAVVIDEFDGPQQSFPPGMDSAVVGPGILGGERELWSNPLGLGSRDYTVEIDALGSSALHITHPPPGVELGFVGLVWDGVDVDGEPPGLGGVDLTQGGTHDSIAVRVLSAEPGALALAVESATGFEVATVALPAVVTPQIVHIPFDLLSVDVTSVDRLGLLVSNLDAQIDWVRTGVVPEPSGIVLAVLALTGLAVFALRRRCR